MTRLGIRLIAISEIVGGILALVGYGVGLWKHVLPLPAWSYVVGVSIALMAITAGIELNRGHRWGYALCLAFQAAQVFQFKASTFVFQIVLGPMITVNVRESALGAQVGIFGVASVWWRAPAAAMELEPSSSMAVNIVAIVALLFLVRQSQHVLFKPAATLAPAAEPLVADQSQE